MSNSPFDWRNKAPSIDLKHEDAQAKMVLTRRRKKIEFSNGRTFTAKGKQLAEQRNALSAKTSV